MSLYNFQLGSVKYFCQVYDGSGARSAKTQDITARTVMYSFVPKSGLLTTTQKLLSKKDYTKYNSAFCLTKHLPQFWN